MRRSWPSVEELLERYDLRVEWFSLGLARARAVPRHDGWGPGPAGLRWPHVVVAREDAGVEYVLHEAAHLICARCLADVDQVPEEDGLHQLERAIARHMAPRERRAVVDYQGLTSMGFEHSGAMRLRILRPGLAEVRDWRRPTRAAWWRRGAELAVEAGLLKPSGEPTWRRHRLYGEPERGYLSPA